MTVDRSKLILYSNDNAFKNQAVYRDSLDFPTSLTSTQVKTVSKVFTLADAPIYTQFFAKLKEVDDAIAGVGSSQWYTGNIAGGYDIAIHVSSPSGNVGWIGAGMSVNINGTTVTVAGTVVNPYSNSITLDALNVPFAFVEYTLAN